MNAWQTLGLAPNSDLHAIKQAYAFKIKQYRPDAHPEQFQQIHQAYKELTTRLRRQAKTAPAATESAATRHTAFSDEPLSSPVSASDRFAQDELIGANELTPDELQLQAKPQQRQPFAEAELRAQQERADSERRQLASEQALQQLRQQRWQERQTLFNQAMAELLQQVDENLNDLHKLESLEHWLFLTKSTWLLEPEFNKQLSAAIVQRLLAYHKNPLTTFASSRKGRGRHREQPIPTSVLKLLDQLFNWRGQQQWQLPDSDQAILAAMFERLDLEAEASAVDALRGKATVVLNEQTRAPQQRPFEWGSLIPWLTLIAIIGQAFKYLQGQ